METMLVVSLSISRHFIPGPVSSTILFMYILTPWIRSMAWSDRFNNCSLGWQNWYTESADAPRPPPAPSHISTEHQSLCNSLGEALVSLGAQHFEPPRELFRSQPGQNKCKDAKSEERQSQEFHQSKVRTFRARDEQLWESWRLDPLRPMQVFFVFSSSLLFLFPLTLDAKKQWIESVISRWATERESTGRMDSYSKSQVGIQGAHKRSTGYGINYHEATMSNSSAIHHEART